MKTTTPGKGSGDDLSISEALGRLGASLNSPEDEIELLDDLADDSIFINDPVSIETFLYDKEYLNLDIRLSPPQLDFVDKCSSIFEEPIYTEGVLQCGQGSGKDTCSVFLCLRLVYLLQCLRSPQQYFKMGGRSFIDIVNIAPTADLAKNIFFDTLISYMESSPYFESLNPASTRKMVTFPNQIRLHSGNSSDDSWQGLTPILMVLDEIDAFKSDIELKASKSLRAEGAEGIYNTAKALVQSRFAGIGKVLSLSWPRFKGSFIQTRWRAGQTEPRTYVAVNEEGKPYSTWEFNPTRTRESLQDFYDNDPILAAARFSCDPPFASDAFIKEPTFVLSAFDAGLDDKGEIVWAGERNVVRNGIRTEADLQFSTRYYIHVDLGQKRANAALCIAHYTRDQAAFIDLLKVWKPEPGIDVILKEVEDFVRRLKREGYFIVECTYDGWQSASSVQNLNRAGINAGYKSVMRKREVYDTFKDLLYQERIIGYFDKDAIQELLSLDIIYNDKVEPRPGALKDRADAIAGAVHGAVKGDANRREIRDVGEIGGLFTNPDATKKEDASSELVDELMGRKPPKLLGPKINARGLLEDMDRCEACNRDGGLEFANQDGRTLNTDDAIMRWCIICGARWRKQQDETSWEASKAPDEERLAEIRGV